MTYWRQEWPWGKNYDFTSKLTEQELNPIYGIYWYIALINTVPPTVLTEGEEGWDV